ncbi:MAG: hypothetical protein GXO06_01155 [Epsilonproteobacteria bacterium]|nr:hypothetical protein [Campylobacterota bacterium]
MIIVEMGIDKITTIGILDIEIGIIIEMATMMIGIDTIGDDDAWIKPM